VDCYNESHLESDLARGVPTRTQAHISGGHFWGQLSVTELTKPSGIKRLDAECDSLPFHLINRLRSTAKFVVVGCGGFCAEFSPEQRFSPPTGAISAQRFYFLQPLDRDAYGRLEATWKVPGMSKSLAESGLILPFHQ